MVSHILALARTPFAPIFGAMAEESVVALGSKALDGALNMGFSYREVLDKVILSQVFTGGAGPSPSKQIATSAKLKGSVCCFQMSHLCTSGLKAVTLAHNSLQSGRARLVATVGVESVSQAPYLLTKARMNGYGIGDGTLVDSLMCDGFAKLPMEVESFLCSAKISKLEMMQYSVESFKRTAACYSDGIMQNEVLKMELNSKKPPRAEGGSWISHSHVNLASDTLYKTFVPNKAITSTIQTKSTMADGAACLVLSGSVIPHECSAVPIARILDYCEVSTEASDFPRALLCAIKEVKASIKRNVDIYDILDQYAFLPLFVAKELNIDLSRINVHGSTLSIGHPMGASGVRQIMAMVTALCSRGLGLGCIAGVNMVGDAIALLVEAV